MLGKRIFNKIPPSHNNNIYYMMLTEWYECMHVHTCILRVESNEIKLHCPNSNYGSNVLIIKVMDVFLTMLNLYAGIFGSVSSTNTSPSIPIVTSQQCMNCWSWLH